MPRPLRILHVEDDPADAELIKHTFVTEGLAVDIALVSERADFVAALRQGACDLILSDFKLPSFDGDSALKLARKICPLVPFILVSGTIGEEVAVDMIKRGATDFVLKDRLLRLGPAVRRALKEAEDRAEHRKLESQLLQSQKIEAIGQLAGGIAHDFNNLLTIINLRSELLMNRLRGDAKACEGLEIIYQAGERAAKLTRQLLAFSRKQVLEPKVLNLNAVSAELEKMLRRLIPENIALKTVYSSTLDNVRADPNQIEQVIVNLAVNARDAMPLPCGGVLTIETANVELSGDYCMTHLNAKAGPYAMLAVSDNGIGMDAATKARIFEPFFTTKEKGKGTGLGLSTVFGIVHQSGGTIEVYSEPGKGTTFKVYLPRVNQPHAGFSSSAAASAVVPGHETVLLVEDEEGVRDIVREILESLGYTVLIAHEGDEALKMCERHPFPADLLMSDVVMPKMGGVELADKLRKLRPGLKVLFTSGYADIAVINAGLLAANVHFLQKPFTPAALSLKLREILDAP